MSIPIFDIPSILFVHPSKPCSFHDSFSGHDQNAGGAGVVPKIATGLATAGRK